MDGNTIPWPMPNQQAQPQQPSSQSQSSPFIPAPFSGQELAAQALHLQSAGSSTQLPANMMPHIKTYQPTPYPAYRQEVGKGNMRGQGIGKAVASIGNLVGQVATNKQNAKELEMASQVSTLLQNQHEIEQAQQTLQANPNDKDAQALIKHNQLINQNILKDDKLRKHIQEGMKIDFTDPSANNTESHNIFAKGKQMAEAMIGKGQKAPPTTDAQAQGYAQKFAAGTPQQMQTNQQAAARLQFMQQANKDNLELNKSYMTYLGAQARAGATIDAATINATNANLRAMLQSKTQTQTAVYRAQQASALEGARFNHETNLVIQRANAQVGAANDIRIAKEQDPLVQRQMQTEEIGKKQATLDSLITRQTAIQREMDFETNPDKITQLQKEYDTLTPMTQAWTKDVNDTKTFYIGLPKVPKGGTNVGSVSNTQPGVSKQQPQAVAAGNLKPTADTAINAAAGGEDDDSDDLAPDDSADPLAAYFKH